MARQARPGKGTVIKFISFDDSAIGGDPATKVDRYRDYLNTAKLSVLELDRTQEPAFYYLRPLTSRESVPLHQIHSRLAERLKARVEVLQKAEAEGVEPPDLSPEEQRDMKALDAEYEAITAEIVEDCLIGCDAHQIVGDITEDGELEVGEPLTWKIGTKPPPGLKASILGDSMLPNNMLRLLLTSSGLTEKEKNRSV